MRKVDKEKRSAIITRKILTGSTWDELEREYELTRAYMQACLKRYVKSSQQYNSLLAKARENSKANTIYLAETGALLNNYGFLRTKKRVFVPDFCRKEIKKLEPNNYNVLNNSKICWCDIPWERIQNLPGRVFKKRTIGIAAFCCAMAKRNINSKVVVYTNSRELKELVEAQTINNISIVKF